MKKIVINLKLKLMKLKNYFFIVVVFAFTANMMAQKTGPNDTGILANPISVPSIAEQINNGTIIYADNTPIAAKPKKQLGNNVVPGKGSQGEDLALQTNPPIHSGKAPSLVFDADFSQATPSDPTGVAGPNHYVAAWNSAFRVFDKSGNPLTSELSLATLFPGNAIGDPIVIWDAYADNGPGEPKGRFIITEFDNSPNGFNMAICKGPDPVNDGWWIYTTGFGTGQFPDYTKFSVWSDGYYVTANIGTKRVFAVERDKMLNGDTAQFVSLPLTGIVTSGFYSPQGFNATNGSQPERGNFSVVYLQDDAWGGVANDHLKVWTVNVDWENTANSTISSPQEITTTDFISVFDGGSFSNLSQPSGPAQDALQATIMNQAQFRQFDGYNSVIFNFVVDTDATGGEMAGIRWYELRQPEAGQPWTIYQEGTYTAPGGRHAFSGSMAMDIYGNIGMGYTSLSNSEMISIRYTGRLASDPLNDMTVAEELIAQSTGNNPSNRLADYVQLSVDPVDDRTFWHIAEYFKPGRRDVVGVFDLGNTLPTNDVAIVDILPNSGLLTANEDITITIENYGTSTVTSVPVTYMIDGGTPVSETYSGSIAPGATDTFTFNAQADLSSPQHWYRIEATSNMAGDMVAANNYYAENTFNEQALGQNELTIENAELIISSSDNKHFDISLITNYSEIIPFSVYDISGKLLVFNNLVNAGNKYTYSLDMSYVASGVYLIKLGEGNIAKTAKIIVK